MKNYLIFLLLCFFLTSCVSAEEALSNTQSDLLGDTNNIEKTENDTNEISETLLSDTITTEDTKKRKPSNLTEEELSSDDSELAPVFYNIDISVPDNERVEKFRKQYTTEAGKKWLLAIMKNSEPYRGYVRKIIKEKGAPACLEFLPVVESGYKITAISRSGALGLWQFMRNSISQYNLRINEWMDERKDPWLSTEAAIQKLLDNYETFGDWYLAIAAYNAGTGGVQRAIDKSDSYDYWYLADKGYLPSETRNYVPKFLAIAEILSNPTWYDLDIKDIEEDEENIQFEEIKVTHAIDLAMLSEKIDADEKQLKFLNPCLTYNITPLETDYRLRLPVGYTDIVQEVLKQDEFALMKYNIYKVKSGDSLYALALHYGVSVNTIQKVNGIRNNNIKVGQKLLIPAFTDVGEFKNKLNDDTLKFDGRYTIKEDDTLWSLSIKYDVQVEALAEANNLSIDTVLRIGSTIKVPIR